MFEIKDTVSYVVGGILLLMGLLPLLNTWGLMTFDLFLWFPGIMESVIVLLGALWLAIDGFGEEHFFKTASLIFALLLGIVVAVPIINAAGWLPFGLPNLVLATAAYLYVIGGALLIIGPFVYN